MRQTLAHQQQQAKSLQRQQVRREMDLILITGLIFCFVIAKISIDF